MYARSVVLVFLGACCYGVLSTFVKLAYADGYDTGHVMGSEMLFGMLMLWALAWPYRRQWVRLSWREVLRIAAAGSLVGITGIFYYTSLRYIPASIAIVLLFQCTWIGVLLEALTTRRVPHAMKGISVAVLLAGTVLASGLYTGDLGRLPLVGLVLGFLSAVSYALFIYLSGRVAPTVSPWLRSPIMITGSFVVTILVFPPAFLVDGSLAERLSLWGFLLALFGAVLPTIFFTFGVPHIGPGLASILGSAELPMAVLMSRFVLGEAVSAWQWVGVALILFGVVIAELKPPRWIRVRHPVPSSGRGNDEGA